MIDFFRELKAWLLTVFLGSFLVAVTLVVHSDLTAADIPYNPNSIPGVTFMSSLAAFLFSAPTILSMMAVVRWSNHRGWDQRRCQQAVQGVHAVGAATTFGIILYNDWDIFSVVCAVIYPTLGAALWWRALRQRSNR